MNKALFLLLFIGFLTVACSSIAPNKEYALAQAMILTAKKSSADKIFPKTFLKAIISYKKGAQLYKKQNYEEARNAFEDSIQFAEKADLKTRLKLLKESE